MGEEDLSDDVGFFEQTDRSTDDSDSFNWPLTRRQTLRGGLAAGVPLVGAAGTRTLGNSTTDPLLALSRSHPSENQLTATRRHVSSVGPVFSDNSFFGFGSSWVAYEYIDTELYYYGAFPRPVSGNTYWTHLFTVRSVAVQTREFDDGSVELYERARPSHELTVELSNISEIDVDEDGVISPGQLEEGLSEMRSRATSDEQLDFPELLHKAADIEDRLDEYAGPHVNRHEEHWPLVSLRTAGKRNQPVSEPAVEVKSWNPSSEGRSESFSLSGTFEPGAAVGSAARFSVLVDPSIEQAPSLSITAQYGSAPRERTQEWTVGLESFPPLSKTEEYAFGRDELENWPLLSYVQIGRNGIDESAVDNRASFSFGDVVAEDYGWTTSPVARPDPTIRRTSGTAASQSPDTPLHLRFANPGEQWDPVWFLFGSGVESGYEYSESSEARLYPSELQPGHIRVGVQVDDRYGLSGLGELDITVADAQTLGVTSVSEQSAVLWAEVTHPEQTSHSAGWTEYRANFQYKQGSGAYETAGTVDSSETGGPVSTTLTGLDSNIRYSYKVALEEVETDVNGNVVRSSTLAESAEAAFVTDASGGDTAQ